MADNQDAQRKRLTVFYGKDAIEPGADFMPVEGVDEAVQSGLEKMQDANFRQGLGDKFRVLFSEPGEDGMSLAYVWFKSGYILPRHSHNADCLYFVLGGELRLGSHILRKGDGFFVPADHGYGYEAGPDGVEVLEFRNASRYNFVFRGNTEAMWDRMIETFRDRSDIWEKETVPPSDK